MDKSEISIERRVIMFMDIHDYSIVDRSLGGKHFDFLQDFYETIGDIVVSHGGEILKYMGDSMLCIFPSNSEIKTVQCAIQSREAFARLLTGRNITHGSELEIGVGAGEVAVGIFGHSSLRMKDIFGDEVNSTAMIMHHRGIAVTQNVREKIRDIHKTKLLFEKKVKWQSEPLKAWGVEEE